MVRTQDILSGVFRTDQASHVSEETYRERTKRTEPTHGDLFYSREGTYFGIAAEVPRNYQICLGQRMVLLRPNSQAVNFRYLRFWLNSPMIEAHIHGFRDGSVAERLNLPTIRTLPVLLPPLPEQRTIAHILGTLDDKIELNRRMNATLEEMARTLFKSWFVDFDPVHAKATLKRHAANQASRQFDSSTARERVFPSSEGWPKAGVGRPRRALVAEPTPPLSRHPSEEGIGEAAHRSDRRSSQVLRPQGGREWTVERARAYLDGLDPSIAALFPDSFVDSELGPIPAGWEISTIGREVNVVGGSTPSTKEPQFWNGGVYWATPKDLSTLSSPVLLKTNRTITEAGVAQISSGLLPTGTVLLSSRAPIGYLAIAEIPVSINQGFIAMKCLGRISSMYAWLWIKHNMSVILQNANGSTFQEISKRNFRPLPMLVASARVLAIFNEIVTPLYGRIAENERESHALSALRDTLLPKLISGELRVEDSRPFLDF